MTRREKLWMYQLICYVPTLAYSHDLWVVSAYVTQPMEGKPPSSHFFKTKHLIEVSEYIFKQNNVFTALNMHVMMSVVFSWLENLVTFWEIWEEETHPYYKGLLA